MAIVYLGLGSNIGDRKANLNQAILNLESRGITVNKVASFIETDPIGGPPQGRYLNSVIECETLLPPLELLFIIQNIEKIMGRDRTVLNGPRIIDIDMLLYEKLKIQSKDLILPHPRMKEREFVIKPFMEIAPRDLIQDLVSDFLSSEPPSKN